MRQYTWEFQQLNTINYGLVNASRDVTVILNLGCPDSRAWYLENEKALFTKVDNGIQLTWTAKHAKKRAVPVVKYRRTTLTLNGKTLTDKQVKQQWSGNLVVR